MVEKSELKKGYWCINDCKEVYIYNVSDDDKVIDIHTGEVVYDLEEFHEIANSSWNFVKLSEDLVENPIQNADKLLDYNDDMGVLSFYYKCIKEGFPEYIQD